MSSGMTRLPKLGLIAGLGDLPVEIYKHCLGTDRDVAIVRISGFEEPKLEDAGGHTVGIGEIGKLFNVLKSEGCSDIVFAGIVKRPSFDKLKVDFRGARLLPKVIATAAKGDDALLTLLVDTFEKEGFRVIGAHEAQGVLTAPSGTIAGVLPSEPERSDIVKAARIAALIGKEDIGQGCVVCDGLVLAVEAQEGTDQMLARCAGLPEQIRGTEQARRGVLVKRPKPGQERRIDLPTIGVSTLERAYEAGLSGIAVEAGGALILNQKHFEEKAKELNLFVYGFTPDEVI